MRIRGFKTTNPSAGLRRYNAAVLDFRDELSLLIFVLINLLVLAGAWYFASRRITASLSQAILDAALLGYAVQYVAVGSAGLCHCLNAKSIDAIAIAVSVMLFCFGFGAGSRQASKDCEARISDHLPLVGIGCFAASMIVLYARSQANLPVISNDAMTYQFPAAVQWLQQRRISLFQTWFFNPANTYSPLAGSMFVVWLLAPFGGDVVARFVEVPALICVGIAMYRLCREMQVRPSIAALVAAAAVLAKPIFLPSMMAKDDLFVAFFFITSIVALSPARNVERFGRMRIGIAVGLLLATKYTALLIAPVLVLGMSSPPRRVDGWGRALMVAMALAGPWYLRNWLATGNPIFPMFSLFTTSHSDGFHSWSAAPHVIVGGTYGMPYLPAVALAIGWLIALPKCNSHPILRACAFGPILGFALFFDSSPFPEVRFVLPIFLLLFGCAAVAIEQTFKKKWTSIAAATALLGISICTIFASQFISVALEFAGIAAPIAIFGLLAAWWAGDVPLRRQALVATIVGIAVVYAYINWRAYCRDYRQRLFDDGTGYAVKYPELNELWRFVNEKIPADATVAYTNLYLIYPLQCSAAQRQLVYAPTRAGVKTIADLGWLGSKLSGENLVPAAIRATVASPDRNVWLSNLRAVKADYLIIAKIGNGGVIENPPELGFAENDCARFAKIYSGVAGEILQFSDGREGRDPTPPGRR